MMRSRGRVLVVDDEPTVVDAMAVILADHGCEVRTALSRAEAVSLFDSFPFDLVFTDFRLPDSDGIEVLAQAKAHRPSAEVVLMTGHGSLDVTIEAIKKGAYYYLEKPFTPDQVLMLTDRALQFAEIRQQNETLKVALKCENDTFGMVGRSSSMRQIHETIRATARSDASVLIEGESGTGKELIAAAFHLQSARAARPFIRINCAAIPHELIESELFGYRKGAFTGADRDKRGLIEATSGGTLLLDEIADMPPHLQSKLLRVLQEHKIRRLGSEQEIEVDFRLIAATNRDTTEAMQTGRLREDLYFRVSTIRVLVPPLRERLDDLTLLAEHFLRRYSQKYDKRIVRLSKPALTSLAHYDWPGNIRELESVIECAVLFCSGEELAQSCLPDHLKNGVHTGFQCNIPPFFTLEEIEREVIEQTLKRTGGNIKKTAEILDLHRPTLYRKLRKFGIKGADRDDTTDGARLK
jgi:DNA-binding NtrC family response regulator